MKRALCSLCQPVWEQPATTWVQLTLYSFTHSYNLLILSVPPTAHIPVHQTCVKAHVVQNLTFPVSEDGALICHNVNMGQMRTVLVSVVSVWPTHPLGWFHEWAELDSVWWSCGKYSSAKECLVVLGLLRHRDQAPRVDETDWENYGFTNTSDYQDEHNKTAESTVKTFICIGKL